MSDFPKLSLLDETALDNSLVELIFLANNINERDRAVMQNRWREYGEGNAFEFTSGFVDGYIKGHKIETGMGQAYDNGFADGYAYAQMLDNQGDIK